MKQTKQIELPEKMTIELPAEALGVIENSQNAYIHANGVVYRVIEESKYWNEIKSAQQQERQRVIEEVESWLVDEPIEKIKVSHIGAKKGYYVKTKDPSVYIKNKLRAELRSKLNQMKGSDETN